MADLAYLSLTFSAWVLVVYVALVSVAFLTIVSVVTTSVVCGAMGPDDATKVSSSMGERVGGVAPMIAVVVVTLWYVQ